MKSFSLRDPEGSSNLIPEKQEVTKVKECAYHSIPDDERSPKMCTDLKLVQFAKSYARMKMSNFQAFRFFQFFVLKS